jgi:transcriptional regulator with XRE-family HTH domain
MTIDLLMSDATVLQKIGRGLAQRRVELELTQADLAAQAGIAKRTVERVEAGESTQTANLIRIFRILGLIYSLTALLPETGPRPLDLLKLKGKQRQRASSKKRTQQTGTPWSWGEGE